MLTSFQAHSHNVNLFRQFPNGLIGTGSDDKTVKIWNQNWTLILTYLNHTGSVFGLEWINNQTIASGGDQTIQIWSILTGQTQRKINAFGDVDSLKLLSNGFHVAAGLSGGNIEIYDINNGSLISVLTGHGTYVFDLVLINNSTLASGSVDNTVFIWDLQTYTHRFQLINHTTEVHSLKQISSDLLASGSADLTVKLWNTTTGELIRTLKNHTDQIFWSLDLVTNGGQTRFVSGSIDTTIKLWNYEIGECLKTINTGLQIRALATIKSKNIFSSFFEAFNYFSCRPTNYRLFFNL